MQNYTSKFLFQKVLRRWVTFFVYTGLIGLSLWFSYQLRFDFFIDGNSLVDSEDIGRVSLWVIPLKLIILFYFRQFSGLLSFFSTPDLYRIAVACSISSGLVLMMRLLEINTYLPPRGVILIDFILTFGLVCSFRIVCRIFRERFFRQFSPRDYRIINRVGIIGAGAVGANLAKEFINKRGLGKTSVAFFDDDDSKWGLSIYDIPVVGKPEILKNGNLNLRIDEIVIALPGASTKRFGEIVRLLQSLQFRFTTVPSMAQLATGKVRVSQLREVQIDDLLGRKPVETAKESIRTILIDRTVLVTGAGGSIGGELCRQIAEFNPRQLLILEQSEVQMFLIQQELLTLGYRGTIVPLIADILDENRMRQIFGRFRPEVLFHAAAHKHVPLMEAQPSEAIKNNTIGTAKLAQWAAEFEVDRFVMISTDKAINPTNVMGASKRLAEIYIQSLFASNGSSTKFMAVRFGNVLGSSGSVIPTFKKQIASGGPVKVTHPDVTRYFMTIPEAVGLVLQSGSIGKGGEIFVLDMGDPVKILDLACQLIELSGLVAYEDIDIEFIGLRPGEKLFEELQHTDENIKPTDHDKVFCFVSEPKKLEEIQAAFDELEPFLHSCEASDLKLKLKDALPEYKPYLT